MSLPKGAESILLFPTLKPKDPSFHLFVVAKLAIGEIGNTEEGGQNWQKLAKLQRRYGGRILVSRMNDGHLYLILQWRKLRSLEVAKARGKQLAENIYKDVGVQVRMQGGSCGGMCDVIHFPVRALRAA